MKKTVWILFAVVALALSSSCCFAAEKKYPTRKIDVIIPYGPGSTADVALRAFAPSLQKILGVPVVAINVSGKNGLLGMEHAAKQPADGYNLLLCSPTHVISEVAGQSDTVFSKAFEPLAGLVNDVPVIVARADSPFASWGDVAAYAKENPKKLLLAGVSPKGVDGLVLRAIAEHTGVALDLKTFEGGRDVAAALNNGSADLAIEGLADAVLRAENKELKILLVGSGVSLPGAATMEMPGVWRGLAIPVGTSPEIKKILETAIQRAYAGDVFQDWLRRTTLDQRQGWKNPQEFGAVWRESFDFFAKNRDALGLRP